MLIERDSIYSTSLGKGLKCSNIKNAGFIVFLSFLHLLIKKIMDTKDVSVILD